jgi:predicted glycosyltransferase
MRILIYVAHPAQYHFFKFIIKDLQAEKHIIKFLIRTKDIIENLCIEDSIEYTNIEPVYRKNNRSSIIWSTFKRVIRLTKETRLFKPDIIVSSDITLPFVARITGRKFISVFEDDYDIVKTALNIAGPFSHCFLTPIVCNTGPWKYKKIGFDGYMKLAYLHPKRFVNRRDEVLSYLGNKKYCFLRIVSLDAYHDKNKSGISNNLLREIIRMIELKGLKIFISSEGKVLPEFAKYELDTPKNLIHSIMANAQFIICDSQSMAVEASILGIPSIRFNDFAGRISVLNELEEKYKLTYGVNTSQPEKLLEILNSFLEDPDLNEIYSKRKAKMLADKIEVTSFMEWFILNFPQSKQIMKDNPAYQYQFK